MAGGTGPGAARDDEVDKSRPLFQGLVRGMLPLYLLMLLEGRPCHGTDMIRAIAAMSRGGWRPSPGSVYPVLRRLEREGLVSGRWQRGQAAPKRVYRLTAAGRGSLPGLQASVLDELRQARRVIDQHVEALEGVVEGGGHGRPR